MTPRTTAMTRRCATKRHPASKPPCTYMEVTMFSLATKTRARLASSRSIGRVLSAVALSFVVMGATACGGDDKKGGTEPNAVAGTYALKTVANVSVPAQILEAEG